MGVPPRFASGRAFRTSAIAPFLRNAFGGATIPNAKKKRNSKEFRLRNYKIK